MVSNLDIFLSFLMEAAKTVRQIIFKHLRNTVIIFWSKHAFLKKSLSNITLLNLFTVSVNSTNIYLISTMMVAPFKELNRLYRVYSFKVLKYIGRDR